MQCIGLSRAYKNSWIFPYSPCDRPRVIESLRGREVVDVAAGGAHSACITASGELYTWGKGRYGRLGHGDSEDQPRPKLVSGCGVANWPHEHVHVITDELLVEQYSILWVSIIVDLFSNLWCNIIWFGTDSLLAQMELIPCPCYENNDSMIEGHYLHSALVSLLVTIWCNSVVFLEYSAV